MAGPDVSFVIRAYNEAQKIESCLKRVLEQRTGLRTEIIIVYTPGSDGTQDILSRYPVKIVEIGKEEFSYGRALNRGCEAARGKYIVFLSAHAIPTSGKWLDTMIKNFEDPRVAGVYGKEVPDKDCNPLTRRHLTRAFDDVKRVQTSNPNFCNPDSVILKSVWKRFKFDEHLAASEDQDWGRRVLKRGFAIVYEPGAKVYHSHNETPLQLYRRHYREFYTMLKIRRKRVDGILFILAPGRFLLDTIYLIRNLEHPKWFLRSIVNNVLVSMAVTRAFYSRNLIDKD
jgi:rhamnosyltransferase